MRQLMMAACLMMVSSLVFSQKRVDVDPSYSVNNYKHANKAAYAKKHNLDKPVKLQTVLVSENGDYKHPVTINRAVTTRKSTFSVAKDDKSGRTEKHPLGL